MKEGAYFFILGFPVTCIPSYLILKYWVLDCHYVGRSKTFRKKKVKGNTWISRTFLLYVLKEELLTKSKFYLMLLYVYSIFSVLIEMLLISLIFGFQDEMVIAEMGCARFAIDVILFIIYRVRVMRNPTKNS